MGFCCGIVGLPNVGKSTIFNALTAAGIESANYPFCTIEPNVGVVPVPDERLDHLAAMVRTKNKVNARMEFLDIAGLVKGASQGEGLGNQFLGHIRQVDAILHVVRCFKDDNIVHVSGNVDPRQDREIINTELILADLSSVRRRRQKTTSQAKSGDKIYKEQLQDLAAIEKHLDQGQPARTMDLDDRGKILLQELFLLSAKPVLYVANVAEYDIVSGNPLVDELTLAAAAEQAALVMISGAIEEELSQLAEDERRDFLADLGLNEPGLHRLIRKGYELLGLITFFTVGEKETRAWTVIHGSKAPQAAGTIHSDFERGFIRAEVIACQELLACGNEAKAREKGLLRLEGKDYIIQDGDCVNFRFNV
ncbi:MAG: redox-regulated ATPase YchF [Desulfobulbaceae bacterium]|nr:MAG: redox-regulated ATPase YchF [Desulfobulbaceae bacterium]